jgi:hypothetical protein
MQQANNLCFYSNKCQWSRAFISEIAKTPWKNQFTYICVDPSPSRPQLPNWLKKVPTIVIAGEAEPRTDSDVMNWLYEKKMREGSPSNGPGSSALGSGGSGGNGGGGGHQAVGGGDPMGFNMLEQVSFAKGFSYSGIDVDTSSQGTGGNTMPGAFAFLNGGDSVGVRESNDFPGGGAPAGGVSSQRRSKKEELFDKQMEAYQRERNNGMPPGPSRMGGGL